MAITRWIALTVALAAVATACGGDDEDRADGADGAADDGPVDERQDAAPDEPSSTDASTSPATAEQSSDSGVSSPGGDTPIPIARFTAHGPHADNTIGPSCSMGIDDRGGDVFRFTPPEPFAWKGTSGGTGADQVELEAGEVSLFVTVSAYDSETALLSEWQVIGPAGADVEIDGVTLPIMEVTLEGFPGYAIVDVDYLSPMPVLSAGAALGTVAVTSRDEGHPTLDEATELLASVRVERCAAVAEALIWGPADGTHLVPRFEPDPLGKSYPDQAQPVYTPGVSPLDAYSLEQIAYLMPVESDVAMCAAEQARAAGADNPIAYLFVLTPSGTSQAELDAVVAGC